MLPEPLHPAVVHFPLVLATFLPLIAIGALIAIRRGASPVRAWAFPLVIAAALSASAFLAVRTGEAEEERVEAVVSESVLHDHEEAAERFLVLSGALVLLAGFGVLRGNVGSAARLLATIGSIGLFAAGIQVGAAGGDLVYRHNAASAYANPVPGAAAGEREREH